MEEYSNEDDERGKKYGTNRKCKCSNTRVNQNYYRPQNNEIINRKC